MPGRKNDQASKSRRPGKDQAEIVSGAKKKALPEAAAPAEQAASLASRRRLFETATDGVLILDWNSGAITDANPAVTELLGYCHAELLGKALWDLCDPKEADTAKRAFRRLVVKRFLRHEEMPFLTKAGLPIGLEAAGIVYRFNGEDVIQCNLRHGKEAGEREQSQQQARTLDDASQLVGGVAHDFNHLMSVILGYCEALEAEACLPEPVREKIQEIHNASISARNLTQRLLAFSHRQAARPVAVDLNQTAIRMESILRQLAGPKVQLEWRLGGQVGKIKAEPSQVEQVLMNLVINARDAMPDGGKIVLETAEVTPMGALARNNPSARPGRYAMLKVSDTGEGMDRETQSRIFEPFFSTKPAGQGSGLGLSTVNTIVKQSGGAIEVSSEPGAGTTFSVYFPLCEPGLPEAEANAEKPARGGTETILLVDDSEALRRLMRRILSGCGYAVLESGDPAEALRQAEEHPGPISLVIADLVLPGFSGLVLAEKIAAARPEAKVLFASGHTGDSIARLSIPGLEPGYLEKPFTADQLLEKVREVIDSAR